MFWVVITFHCIHRISYSYFRLMKIFKTLTPVYHLNLYIHQPVLMNFFPLHSVWSSFGQYLPQFTWTFPSPFIVQFSFRRVRKCFVSFWEEDVVPVCFSVITFFTYYMYICPVFTDLTSDHIAKCKHYLKKGEPGTHGLVPSLARAQVTISLF